MGNLSKILLFLLSFLFLFEDGNSKIQFRKVTGIVHGYEIPSDGLLVSYLGIKQAVITNEKGEFCLTVPEGKSVFIEVPICGALSITEIRPSDSYIILEVGNLKNESEYAMETQKRWNKLKNALIPDLIKIYQSPNYNKANLENCLE